jgi:hypothetical protein
MSREESAQEAFARAADRIAAGSSSRISASVTTSTPCRDRFAASVDAVLRQKPPLIVEPGGGEEAGEEIDNRSGPSLRAIRCFTRAAGNALAPRIVCGVPTVRYRRLSSAPPGDDRGPAHPGKQAIARPGEKFSWSASGGSRRATGYRAHHHLRCLHARPYSGRGERPR